MGLIVTSGEKGKPHSTLKGKREESKFVTGRKKFGKKTLTKTFKMPTRKFPGTDIRKKLTDAFAGGVKGKPHSSPEGQAASAGRTIKRIGLERQQKFQGGGRIGFKSGTLKLGKKGGRGIKSIHEQLGGSEKAKPHSTKEGRVASGKRRLERLHRKAMSDYHDITWAGPDREKGKPHSSQEGQIATGRRNFRKALQRHVGGAKPLRAKHGLGSLVRKVITKIKPKPKPGAVKDVNVDKLLKNLGDEIKAAPLPPQLKKSLDKLKKAYPHGRNKESKKVFKSAKGKAKGGRIGLQHGSRPRPSGPHTWVRSGGAVLKGKKVGIQIK